MFSRLWVLPWRIEFAEFSSFLLNTLRCAHSALPRFVSCRCNIYWWLFDNSLHLTLSHRIAQTDASNILNRYLADRILGSGHLPPRIPESIWATIFRPLIVSIFWWNFWVRLIRICTTNGLNKNRNRMRRSRFVINAICKNSAFLLRGTKSGYMCCTAAIQVGGTGCILIWWVLKIASIRWGFPRYTSK